MINGVAIIGAGFSGATVARQLAEAGISSHVFDARSHIAGNCHSARDEQTGVMVHSYGPHIFHTDNESVWRFINRFGVFVDYINRVKSTVKGEVYSLPINLHTINQFFRKALDPRDARNFIRRLGDKNIIEPRNFEEQALKFVGRDLYEAFFKGYTKKQWGLDPVLLPASILKRLPVRFDYNDNYFNHRFQGMPRDGYTEIVKKMLDHPLIRVSLNCHVSRSDVLGYDHVFYSGPLDEWFEYSEGQLGYRTLDFEPIRAMGEYQGCAVMNYGDEEVPFTRISEHKYFSPWEKHEKTIAFREYSRSCGRGDIPYYPIRLASEQKLLERYICLAKLEKNVSFMGRLGTYRYLDMDVTIKEALMAADRFIASTNDGLTIPSFFVEPI